MGLSEKAKKRLRILRSSSPQYTANTERSLEPMKELEAEGLVTISESDADGDIEINITSKGKSYII